MDAAHYVEPRFRKANFTCPACGVPSYFRWFSVFLSPEDMPATLPPAASSTMNIAFCQSCKTPTVWLRESLVYPNNHRFPVQPNTDMPISVSTIFDEAREVFPASPRAAAALLRLALQHLLQEAGVPVKNVDEATAELVRRGCHAQTVQTVGVIRGWGDETVHPGEIDVNEDSSSAAWLFHFLNYATQILFSHPKMTQQMHNMLHKSTRQDTRRRNAKAQSQP